MFYTAVPLKQYNETNQASPAAGVVGYSKNPSQYSLSLKFPPLDSCLHRPYLVPRRTYQTAFFGGCFANEFPVQSTAVV